MISRGLEVLVYMCRTEWGICAGLNGALRPGYRPVPLPPPAPATAAVPEEVPHTLVTPLPDPSHTYNHIR